MLPLPRVGFIYLEYKSDVVVFLFALLALWWEILKQYCRYAKQYDRDVTLSSVAMAVLQVFVRIVPPAQPPSPAAVPAPPYIPCAEAPTVTRILTRTAWKMRMTTALSPTTATTDTLRPHSTHRDASLPPQTQITGGPQIPELGPPGGQCRARCKID